MQRFLFVYWKHPIEPLGIMYLSAALKKAGHSAKITIVDMEDYKKVLLDYKPDIVCGSILTGGQEYFEDLIKDMKTTGHKFIAMMGGIHPTFHPQEIEKSEVIDVIITGEAEEAIVDFANALEKGEPCTNIPNVWAKVNGKIYKNDKRPLVENLDLLEDADREIAMEHEIWRNEPIRHFIMGRGCPFKCTYCFNDAMVKNYGKGKGNWVRFRSVERVVDEIKKVIKTYGGKFVYFQDDTFTVNKPWIEKFSKIYKEEVGLPYHCHIRAEHVTEDMAKLLADSGCYSVHMAIEAANDHIRINILKRGMSREEIFKAAKLLNKYGIKMMLQNMVGLPTSTVENDLETLKINIKCKPLYAWCSIFQPYPGIELTEFAGKRGLLEGDYKDISPKFFSNTVLKMEPNQKKEMEYLHKWFAVAANYPMLYYSGTLRLLMKAPNSKLVKKTYGWIYQKYRENRDNKLYGIKIWNKKNKIQMVN